MEEDMQHLWHIMLYYFKKGKIATETQKQICAACGEGPMMDQTCQKWFVKFPGAIDISAKSLLGAVLCIGRCLASPLASIH